MLNQNTHSFWQILPPFPEGEKISWSPLYSLTEQKIKYYPTACCYYRTPLENNAWLAKADSNGCASGNCLEEAILQGFFELVERDSVAIWWYNQLNRPRVNLDSFHNAYFDTLMKEYARRGREVWLLDITTDLGIPSFVAVSRLKVGEEDQIFLSFGTHLESEIAVTRALTEMNQFILNNSYWENDVFGDGPEDIVNKRIMKEWMQRVKVTDYPCLQGSEEEKKSSDYPKWESSDLLEDINHCRKIVENLGMEMLVLDQTRPEIGLNTVRVIVPGLRHFWPRFAPGRLYETPVKMGLLKTPLKESELNPLWMFL